MAAKRYHRGVIRRRGDSWQADLRLDGKRHRRDLPTEGEAKAWIDALVVEHDQGLQALDAWALRDARRALALLPEGVTLEEAAREYATRHPVAGLTVAEAVGRFAQERQGAGLRPATLRKSAYLLARFVEAFGPRPLGQVSPGEISAWLAGLGVEPVTRNDHRTAVRSLYSWALAQGLTGENPAKAVRPARIDERLPTVLPPLRVQALLCLAPEEVAPYLALGLFAGIRPQELERLDWSAVGAEVVTIGPEVSKVRRQRHVDLEPVLLGWLEPHRRRRGPIWPGSEITLRRRRRALAEAACVVWTPDILRHCFASYHLALYRDAGRTAHQLGHRDAELLYRHYRGLVTAEEAAAFWGLSHRFCHTGQQVEQPQRVSPPS